MNYAFTLMKYLSLLVVLGWHVAVFAAPVDIQFDHVLDLGREVQEGIIQDSEGFLWFGTRDGLFKYDGYTVKAYESGEGSISHGYVFQILEDPHQPGIIWIATLGGGLNRYDKVTDTFSAYRQNPDEATALVNDSLTDVIQDRHDPNILWIGGAGGLSKFDKTTETFRNYLHDPDDPRSLSHPIAYALSDDPDDPDILWVGTLGGGFCRFNKQTERFTVYQYDPADPDSLHAPDNIVSTVLQDADDPDLLWLGTWAGGFNTFRKSTETFTHYKHAPTGPANAFYDDGDGSLWIGSGLQDNNGLVIFDKEEETFTRYPADPDNPESVSNGAILTIYEDRAGIVWLLTSAGKVDKVDPFNQKFELYRHSNAPNSLNHDFVTRILEDRQGIIWLGTQRGLNRYNRETGEVISYTHQPDVPGSLPGHYVDGIMEDSSGRFWLTLYGQASALCQFDREQGEIVTCYNAQGDGLNVMLEDPANPEIFWIGTRQRGLAAFDNDTKTFTYYLPDAANPQSISFDFVDSLYHDRNQEVIWMGSIFGGGLNRFDKTTEIFTQYTHDPDDPHTLGSNTVASLYQESSGMLWVGTKGGGLNKLDPSTGHVVRYDDIPDAPTDVMSILKDDQGAFWLGTGNGIVHFDPIEGRVIRTYSEEDGLQEGAFYPSSALKTRDGELWFGGVKGANSFYPDQLQDNPYIPPVVLTALKQGGEPVQTNRVPAFIKKFDVDWRQNFFEFEFVALNYTRPEQNRYKYKLEGFDDEWFDSDTRRFGRYTNLPPGNYTLRVIGSNNDGVWNREGTSLDVHVETPYWQTWWFLNLSFLGALGVLGLMFYTQLQIRTNRLKAEQEAALHEAAEREKEAAEIANQAKSQFLSNMSHELRTPLNGILGYTQILRQTGNLSDLQEDGLEIIHQSGEHLLTLINDILDLSKIEAGKLDLNPTEFVLNDFLRGIAGIIRMRAEQKNVLFSYEALTPLPLGIRADEKRLRQILLNLLGNAVKFTDEGFVTLNVSLLREIAPDSDEPQAQLRFEVIDTGVGITPAELEHIFSPFEQVGDLQRRSEGTGLGLAISRKLVDVMGGTLQVTSTPGEGSTFWFDVSFPVLAEAPEKTLQPLEQQISGYEGQQRTVLIADDKPYNRQMLLHLLEPAGFEVNVATNGRELVDAARQHPPDAIITDMLMPLMTGFEAVQELRQQPEFKEIPILAVSASAFDQDPQRNPLAGCDAFLLKPIRAHRLFEVLGNLLHLTWQYESAAPDVTATSEKQPETATQAIQLPPDVLEELLYLAKRGNMQKIREKAAELLASDVGYRPLAEQLDNLAKNFAEEEIQELLAHLS